MFRDPPVLTVPERLEYLRENVDGAGNKLDQQAKGAADDVVRKGRAGLYVSYPETNGQVSRADVQAQRYVATIQRLEPEQVINWRVTSDGAKARLSLVVIAEQAEVFEDYERKTKAQMRELFLDENGDHGVRVWEKQRGEDDRDTWVPGSVHYPRDDAGRLWREIPFTFVGAENNDVNVDAAPMLGMAKLNRAHYRNSADFEDSVWFAGQVQPWMSGVTEQHVDLMRKENMYVGSRNVLAVPDGGSFGMEAPPPNPLVRQAMVDKVEMMVGIGARIITQGTAAKTAEQSSGEREIQHSVLSMIANNMSAAYTQALVWAGMYMGGVTDNAVGYAVNQDYMETQLNPQELKEVIAGFMAGSLPLGDYVRYMQRNDLFDQDKTVEDYAEALPGGGMAGVE